MKGRKWFGVLLALFTIFGLSLSVSSSVSALSMPNDFFQINRTYIPETTNWSWSAYMYLPQAGTGVCDSTCYQQYVGQIRKIQINYGNVSTQGNHATIHFELNLVSADSQANNATFFDLSNIAISNVYFRKTDGSGTALTLESYAVNTAVTYWDDNKRITLTIYGDLTLSGVPTNATGHFQLDVGSNQPFYQGRRQAQIVYFEQNPTSLVFSNNLNDALLNQQIAQNEVLIQIQEQQIEQDQQDREDISNTSENGQETGEDAGDAAANKGQTLLQAFGSLITALGQVHQTNCVLPNMTVYSLQLNNMDMCAVSLPQGVSALLGVGICILIVILGIKLVRRMIALYKEITG